MNELAVVERAPEWQRLKALVLDSVKLADHAARLQHGPGRVLRLVCPGDAGFSKAAVSAWRVTLEERGLGSSSIIVRMSAIRKLAVEATDNGLLAPELAAGIQRVKIAKDRGARGELAGPRADAGTPRRAGYQGTARHHHLTLRRSEVGALTMGHIQQRDGRWRIVDLYSKHGRVRTIPVPVWVKVAIDAWTAPAGVVDGFVFRPVNRGGHVQARLTLREGRVANAAALRKGHRRRRAGAA
jgi:integrase